MGEDEREALRGWFCTVAQQSGLIFGSRKKNQGRHELDLTGCLVFGGWRWSLSAAFRLWQQWKKVALRRDASCSNPLYYPAAAHLQTLPRHLWRTKRCSLAAIRAPPAPTSDHISRPGTSQPDPSSHHRLIGQPPIVIGSLIEGRMLQHHACAGTPGAPGTNCNYIPQSMDPSESYPAAARHTTNHPSVDSTSHSPLAEEGAARRIAAASRSIHLIPPPETIP
ncbi:hypothetical protein N657DRAFT_177655 [Parathielavia appendiculata]|uniref:Uncharacterized protein n=1 Tax=Parathielavia appendiculata TaxID=2587402 RepID=A0AAN6U6M8_9PEZI|nr:hypothetical protein N657DRAFT_177655 [Parathielavia appendiculata]